MFQFEIRFPSVWMLHAQHDASHASTLGVSPPCPPPLVFLGSSFFRFHFDSVLRTSTQLLFFLVVFPMGPLANQDTCITEDNAFESDTSADPIPLYTISIGGVFPCTYV